LTKSFVVVESEVQARDSNTNKTIKYFIFICFNFAKVFTTIKGQMMICRHSLKFQLFSRPFAKAEEEGVCKIISSTQERGTGDSKHEFGFEEGFK
jgi:hypothetical protein